MKHQPVRRIFVCIAVLSMAFWGLIHPKAATAGTLRLLMNDGTSIEVPYFWEEGADIKFEIAGGIVGIPKDQVKSIKEVLTAKELDLDTAVEGRATGAPSDGTQQEMLRNLLAASLPPKASAEKLGPEESAKMLADKGVSRRGATVSKEKTFGPLFNVEGDFSELMKGETGEVVYVVRNVLSSKRDLRSYSFSLSLYDGEGNLIEQKPCELHPLNVDKKTMSKLSIKGRLYAVSTSVKPDPKIKRYEITALQKQ